MQQPLISVIMPVFNMAPYIGRAVGSMLDQSWVHWELIIINDGSTDGTADVLARTTDPRIRVVHQLNAGVSAARNRGLDLAQGEYVAFLDADDILPAGSLRARAGILMARPEVAFVDGSVDVLDHATGSLTRAHQPTYAGEVFPKLMCLDQDVFFGQTWMLRRSAIGTHRFPAHMKHAEDLAFFLSLARNGHYQATSEPVLHLRRGHVSAMTDIHGLDRGYTQLYTFASLLTPSPGQALLDRMWRRIRRVMTLGYLKAGHPWGAVKVLCRRRPRTPRGEGW